MRLTPTISQTPMMESESLPIDTALPLQPRTPEQLVPLTGSQLRWWNSLDQGRLGSSRSLATATRILGNLDAGLLRTSIAHVIQRHESLRTRVEVVDGIPTQQIDSVGDDSLQVIDIADNKHSDAQLAARQIATELVDQKIDVASGPLFKPFLLKISSREHILLLAAEHLISDASSAELLAGEVWTLYRRGASNPLSLPSIRVQYADYAVWQQRTYPAWRSQHEAYWKERLTDAPPTRIPVDHDSAESSQLASSVKHFPFGKTLSLELRRLAEQEGTRVQLVVLAIYAYVMSRWCARRDMLMAFASHGRHCHPELKTMIGFLANVVFLRLCVEGSDSCIDLLRKTHTEFKSGFAHYDFDRAVTLVPGLTTDLCFNWISTHRGREAPQAQSDADFRLQPFNVRMAWPGKIWSFFSDTAVGINASVAYRPDLFCPHTIDQIGSDLRLVATAFARKPATRISAVVTSKS